MITFQILYNYIRNISKVEINRTTIGTQTIVVHVTESAVTFFSIPYGIRNILVLVIGRMEFIIITANHAFGIISRMRNKLRNSEITNGVMITVSKKMFLT